jgi:hypothetical protein
MKPKRYIRRADGSLHALADDDDRVAKDGEMLSVGMMFMDAAGELRRVTDDNERSADMQTDAMKYWEDRAARTADYASWMHDADGNPVMKWTDYIGSDRHRKDLERCEAETAAAEVLRDEERRRRPESTAQADQVVAAPSIAQPTAADLAEGWARVEAAYAEYNDRLTNAWKGGR